MGRVPKSVAWFFGEEKEHICRCVLWALALFLPVLCCLPWNAVHVHSENEIKVSAAADLKTVCLWGAWDRAA